MQHFGVSRTVVREAIAKLAVRGLVEARPGFRPVVRKPDYEAAMDSLGHMVGHLVRDQDGVRDLFETRIFMEAALARHAAKSARKEDIDDLRLALERNRKAVATGTPSTPPTWHSMPCSTGCRTTGSIRPFIAPMWNGSWAIGPRWNGRPTWTA